MWNNGKSSGLIFFSSSNYRKMKVWISSDNEARLFYPVKIDKCQTQQIKHTDNQCFCWYQKDLYDRNVEMKNKVKTY